MEAKKEGRLRVRTIRMYRARKGSREGSRGERSERGKNIRKQGRAERSWEEYMEAVKEAIK